MNIPNKSELKNSFRKFFRISWPFFIAIMVFLSLKFSAGNSEFIDKYYSRGIYPVVATLFSSVSKIFSFSLWDLFWIFILWLVISGITLVIFKKMNIGMFFLKLLQALSIMYALFYLVWGYNYFRPSIDKRMGWKTTESNKELFRTVLDSLIVRTNSSYTTITLSEYSDLNNLVEESYSKNCKYLGINYPNGTRTPKVMLMSSIYSKLGVSGYFGPFFNEVHVNYYVLPVDYPFLLGHEKAHQFGVTSEAEANLLAFIICTTAADKRLRYSGYQTLLLYFLRDASHLSDYHDLLKKLDTRVLDDIRFRQKYYNNLESKVLSDMQSKANDSYLKVNHIEKGIMNYNQVVSLVINWYSNSKNY
jgi:hypothetical protein